MNRFTAVAALVLLAVEAAAGAARANPIMVEYANALQVPDSMHVQVSFMCLEDMGECGLPAAIEINGVKETPEWQGPTGVEINGGSGIDTYSAMQLCFCELDVGTYAFKILDGSDSQMGWGDLTVQVVSPPPGPQKEEPMPEGGDVMPWEIPGPPWPQGIDCVAWCQTAPQPDVVTPQPDVVTPQPDVVTPQPDVTAPPLDLAKAPDEAAPVSPDVEVPPPDSKDEPTPTTVKKDDKDDGGCTTAATGNPAAFFLLLLGLAGLRVARRRA
jgi:MYXO-CTERM domain-containing protein